MATPVSYFYADSTPPKSRDGAKPHCVRTGRGFTPLLWLGFFRPMNASWIEMSQKDSSGRTTTLRVPTLICPRPHAVKQYQEFQRSITAVPSLGPMVMTISDDLIPETESLLQNFLYIDDCEVQQASGRNPNQHGDWLRRCLLWVEAVATRKLRGEAVLKDPTSVEIFSSVRVKLPQLEITWEGMEWDAVLGGYRPRPQARSA